MLQPHLLPCISPDELMNAGSDACPPMLVDYKKNKSISEKIGRLEFKGKKRKYCSNGSRHRQQRQLRCVFRGKVERRKKNPHKHPWMVGKMSFCHENINHLIHPDNLAYNECLILPVCSLYTTEVKRNFNSNLY